MKIAKNNTESLHDAYYTGIMLGSCTQLHMYVLPA